jgi:hypothetical protein
VSVPHRRWPAAFAVIGLLAMAPAGCAVDGAGYSGGYSDGYGYGADYYEPYGYSYGGWGSGYYVGPYRTGGRRDDFDGRRSGAHAYRSAPASHGMPSIPSGRRGGGAGGGHSGGGRSR